MAVINVVTAVVASIPSPAHGIVHIGPVPLDAYGLILALGVRVDEPDNPLLPAVDA